MREKERQRKSKAHISPWERKSCGARQACSKTTQCIRLYVTPESHNYISSNKSTHWKCVSEVSELPRLTHLLRFPLCIALSSCLLAPVHSDALSLRPAFLHVFRSCCRRCTAAICTMIEKKNYKTILLDAKVQTCFSHFAHAFRRPPKNGESAGWKAEEWGSCKASRKKHQCFPVVWSYDGV